MLVNQSEPAVGLPSVCSRSRPAHRTPRWAGLFFLSLAGEYVVNPLASEESAFC